MKRIDCITDIMEICDTAADIGCDHGYISKNIIQKGKAKKVYATDISRDSLAKAEKLVKSCGLEESIFTVAGDGIKPIEKYMPQVIIIAGMGGHLISKIMKNSIDTCLAAKQLVLCPHTHQKELRYFLAENGFKIVKEKVIYEDGKYYTIISAQRGYMAIEDDICAIAGINSVKDDEYINYLEYMQKVYTDIANEIFENGGSANKACEYRNYGERISEIRNECIKENNKRYFK